jgi:hypothetical protein
MIETLVKTVRRRRKQQSKTAMGKNFNLFLTKKKISNIFFLFHCQILKVYA